MKAAISLGLVVMALFCLATCLPQVPYIIKTFLLRPKKTEGYCDFTMHHYTVMGWSVLFMLFGLIIGTLFYRHLVACVTFAAIVQCAHIDVRRHYKNRHSNRVLDAFIEITVWLQAGIQSGRSIDNTIKELQVYWSDHGGIENNILYHELSSWTKQMQVGVRGIDLLCQFSDRTNNETLLRFSSLLRASETYGTNSIHIIQTSHRILREHRQIVKEMEVLVSAKKMEQCVMSVMPLLMLALMNIQAGDFIGPLYEDWVGRCLMTGALLIFVACHMWGMWLAECRGN